MLSLFHSISARYTDYMILVGRQRARRVLLEQDTRILQDLGISRALVEKGTQAWPWLEAENQPTPAVQTQIRVSKREVKKAIKELRLMSNYELADIGLTRGTIEHAVRYGRPNESKRAASSQLLQKLAKEAVPATELASHDNTTAANVATKVSKQSDTKQSAHVAA